MVSSRFDKVGIRAVVEGAARYVRDARSMIDAERKLGTEADTAAKKTERLDQRLQKVGRRMQETGRQAVFLGTAMTGLAAGPAFLAARFENAFVKIENLVGISRETLQGMKADVLEIAKDTARGPQELAAALFVITSGGLRGAEAIEALRASASAAALGLGDTATVARVAGQAVLAFREQSLSATDAVDILVATAREGNFETSQLANVFGQVIPLAAELGIKFSDLGAFIASYTRVGGNAAQATTALQAVLVALTRGGAQAIKALEDVDLSLATLQETAREEGLAQALLQILEAAEEGGERATDVLAQIIPNIRALRGVLATAGVQAEEFAQDQIDVANSLGIVSKGLERLGEDPLFKFQQALNNLQITLIGLGDEAAFSLTAITIVLGGLSNAVDAIPGPLREMLIVVTSLGGAFLIAGGTIAIFLGSIFNLLPALRNATIAMRAFGLTTASLTGPLGIAAVTIALVTAAAAWFVYRKAVNDADRAERESAIASDALRFATELTTKELTAQKSALEDLVKLEKAAVDAAKAERDAIEQSTSNLSARSVQLDRAEDKLQDALVTQGETKDALSATNEALAQQTLAEEAAADQAEELKEQVDAAARAFEEAAKAAQQLTAASVATAFATRILRDSLQGDISDNIINQAAADIRRLLQQEAQLRDMVELLTDLADPGGVLRGTDQKAPITEGVTDALDTFADDVESALAAARSAAETELNLLGSLIEKALRRSARAERDIALDAIKAERDARRDAHEERLRQIDEEQRQAVAAIEARLGAVIGPLQAEIDALDEAAETEQRADIVRRLALAFDPRERARIEEELREHDRRVRQDDLRDQIQAAEDGAAGEIDAANDSFDARRELLDAELDLVLQNLDDQRDAARDRYAQQTDAWALESEARRLIMEDEQAAIVALLEAQVPEWVSAGQSFGAGMIDGLRQSGVSGFVADLIGAQARGGAASSGGARGLSPQAQRDIGVKQFTGINLKGQGAPDFVLDALRREIRSLGGIPAFHQGGVISGGPSTGRGREVLVRALPGEGVLTQAQMAAMSRPVFEPGAFRGMFEGATLAGSPQENASAIESVFERLLDRALTRSAFVGGAA